jgi:tetratricopeptide (TPR) repeat protein
VAALGRLDEAAAFLLADQLAPAWESTLAALEARPFHPAAWLLLAEIALAAGDRGRAVRCAERAGQLAPRWKAVKDFARRFAQRPAGQNAGPRLPWPDLPDGPQPAPLLTVCLIVRNEERFLPACLDSIRPVAEQVVVVDTGSTDRTVEIARAAGAEVHSFAWCDDFAAARNAALAHARGDWVLVLDADEELPAASLEDLRRHLRERQAMAFRLPIVDAGAEARGRNFVPRLFRNAPGVFFAGRIHEHPFGSVEPLRLQWGLENQLGRAVIRHHGYSQDVQRDRNKIARNLALIERALEDQPQDVGLLMNRGLELMRSGRDAEGLHQYRRTVAVASALPAGQVSAEGREALLTQAATYLLAARDHAGLVQVLQSPLARSAALTASMHYILGLSLLEQRRPSEASRQFRQCLALREHPVLTPIHADVRTAAPRHCLALCLKAMQQPDAARRAFAEAVAEEPGNWRVRLSQACFLAEQGTPIDALRSIQSLLLDHGHEPEVWVAGGRIALGRPDLLEFALDWTGEAVRVVSDHPELQGQRAEALLLAGRTGEALSFWDALVARSPDSPRALAGCLICRVVEGQDCRVPEAAHAAVQAEFLPLFSALVKAGATQVVIGLQAELPRLRRSLPPAGEFLGRVLQEVEAVPAA